MYQNTNVVGTLNTAAGEVNVALELDGAQPRRPLPDSSLGPAEPLGQVAQAAAAMLPVERRGQAFTWQGLLKLVARL